MMFLEMSRYDSHGGGAWAFPNCVFAPTERKGGDSWAFWSNILKIRSGDLVLHLRGIPPDAKFVGYSEAASDGFETGQRPPDPAVWSYSNRFYRADLKNYVAFHTAINLTEVFSGRRQQLEAYFDQNKLREASKLSLFYVRQAGRIQCLNGAYLSEVDDAQLEAIFGDTIQLATGNQAMPSLSVQTGTQLIQAKARLGQQKFSSGVKQQYGYRCCFPDCTIDDPRFLIGSHIARWSDNEELRGHLGNGLSLCPIHDRAFELGLFTVDQRGNVFLNPKEFDRPGTVHDQIRAQHGKPMRLNNVALLEAALIEHWLRVDIDPMAHELPKLPILQRLNN